MGRERRKIWKENITIKVMMINEKKKRKDEKKNKRKTLKEGIEREKNISGYIRIEDAKKEVGR